MLEQKVISFCYQYKRRPACTSMKSDQTLRLPLADQLSSSHLDISKNDNGECQKWKMDYSKKKFNGLKFINRNVTGHLIQIFNSKNTYTAQCVKLHR